MKYFTKEWWFGDAPDADLVFEHYRAYISTVRDRLPAQLIDLYENHTLHDAEVKRIAMSATGGTVELELLGWDIELQNQVRYNLAFSGVTSFEQVFPEAEYVEQELGDLGYWECEHLGSETEMRMLFATEATFTVRFSDFSFKASAVMA